MYLLLFIDFFFLIFHSISELCTLSIKPYLALCLVDHTFEMMWISLVEDKIMGSSRRVHCIATDGNLFHDSNQSNPIISITLRQKCSHLRGLSSALRHPSRTVLLPPLLHNLSDILSCTSLIIVLNLSTTEPSHTRVV